MAKRRKEPENSVCVFSGEEPVPLYRYTLEHRWDDTTPSYARTTAAWVLLNPSTADTQSLDPTLRRCRGYSRAWGYGGMVILNAFAFRSTLPEHMLAAADPVGPLNDHYIERTLAREDIKVVVVGWGKHGNHRNRAAELIALHSERLSALAVNKDGTPGHPLYLKSSLVPVPYFPSRIILS